MIAVDEAHCISGGATNSGQHIGVADPFRLSQSYSMASVDSYSHAQVQKISVMYLVLRNTAISLPFKREKQSGGCSGRSIP